VGFDLTSALGIFAGDFFFWFLTTIYVKKCNGNLIVQIMLVAGLTNLCDFVSKYFAPQHFSNIVVAFLAAATGTGAAMLYDRWGKKKQKNKLYILPLAKKIAENR
jgi:hypothetical protein